MAQYALDKLLSLWYQGQVTVEQVIGQLIQHLIAQEKQLAELKRQLSQLPPKQEE
ncbi:MAG TPA: hypothetical protein VEC93_09025 [Anaerolineae bacterium]|nr:hypothetical protein [Anaerolineae bacterium]